MSKKQLTKGFCVLTNTLNGWELTWSTVNSTTGEVYPEIYETEKAAQEDVTHDYNSILQSFKDGYRKFNQIGNIDDHCVAQISIGEEGELLVYDENLNNIICTTLKEWQENL